MRVLLTGANGFLGWHTRVRLHATTKHEVVPIDRSQWQRLPSDLARADAVVHVAGINRGTDTEVQAGNIALAEDLASALRIAPRAPRIIFANSIQASLDNPYGIGKRDASRVLQRVATEVGAPFVDVILPNLFGEHGRPDYNSFIATFVDRVTQGETPAVSDRELNVLHVQAAAQSLIDGLNSSSGEIRPTGTATSVLHVLKALKRQHSAYVLGDIPVLASQLDVDLFNTLRSAMFIQQPLPLVVRSDSRGALVETVRMHGSQGQSFISTTRPGVTRGQHFHLRKAERFVVLSGRARISLRRMFTDIVHSFDVDGDQPMAIDMPTLWAHKITNIGDTELTTMFWTNELFDPQDTDTYPEEV